MTVTGAFVEYADPVVGSDGVELARRRHLATCSREVRRLRGLLIHAPAERLALIDAVRAYGEGSDTAWTRLRRAVFATCDPQEVTARERLILMAIAVQEAAHRQPVFSHDTASAVLQLPAIGRASEFVEFATSPGARGRKSQVRRRRTSIAPTTVEVDRLLVTDVDRTVIDRARTATLESAVTAADAALHLDLSRQSELLAQARALPRRSRGCRMAELAILLADGRAESPLESLSRTRMFQLGIPMPELQTRFYDAAGFIGRVDFFWPAFGVIGEADGRIKFRVTEGQTGKEAEEAVWRAKRRDDRLRRHPKVREVGHWDWGEALHPGRFAAMLTDLGVPPVRDSGGWPLPDAPLPRRSRHVSVIERTHKRATGP